MSTTPNNHVIVGHNNPLEITLILILRISVGHVNVQPMPNLQFRRRVGHIKFFPRKLMWVIILFMPLLSLN